MWRAELRRPVGRVFGLVALICAGLGLGCWLRERGRKGGKKEAALSVFTVGKKDGERQSW